MTRSSENPEPELCLNTNSKYCLAEITHLGETLGRMQIGQYKSIPNTFASVDKQDKDWIPQPSLAGRGSAGCSSRPAPGPGAPGQRCPMTVATGTHGGRPVMAYQQLWQLVEQLDIIRQWLWLERSPTPAYAKPETSNLHVTGTNRNGVTALT